MSSKKKYLIVGLGSIGRRHLSGLRTLGIKDEDIVILRSRNAQNKSAISDLGNVSVVYDLECALKFGLKAAFITNPTSCHMELALPLAEANCNLFLEKPVSHNIDGLDQLTKLVSSNKLVTQVGYLFRFHPAIIIIKRWLDEHLISDLISVRAWFGKSLIDWHPGEDYRKGYMAKEKLGGGLILTMSHEIDYLIWFFGDADILSSNYGNISHLEMETEDWANINLRFKSGIIGNIYLDCFRIKEFRGLEIIGQSGEIHYDFVSNNLNLTHKKKKYSRTKTFDPDVSKQIYLTELKDFLDAIENPACQTRVPLEEGIRTLKYCLEMKKLGSRI